MSLRNQHSVLGLLFEFRRQKDDALAGRRDSNMDGDNDRDLLIVRADK